MPMGKFLASTLKKNDNGIQSMAAFSGYRRSVFVYVQYEIFGSFRVDQFDVGLKS